MKNNMAGFWIGFTSLDIKISLNIIQKIILKIILK